MPCLCLDLKLVILGMSNAGKTSILNRYINQTFTANMQAVCCVLFVFPERDNPAPQTAGVAFSICNWNGLRFALWDTAGQEKYASLSSWYCREARAAILVFDLADRDTFDNLHKFHDLLKQSAKSDVVVVLVGNKVDIVQENPQKRAVTSEDARQYAQSVGAAAYFESRYNTVETTAPPQTHTHTPLLTRSLWCSALKNEKISDIFDAIGNQIFSSEEVSRRKIVHTISILASTPSTASVTNRPVERK